MYTIGQVAKKFNLSRSALLYYDSLGLVSPGERTAANYRLYSEEDLKRLEMVCLYRKTGIPLEDIKTLLETTPDETDQILQQSLQQLNKEIELIHLQKQMIVQMIKNKEALKEDLSIKNTFIESLQNIGLKEKEMNQLHVEFERLSPEKHQAFLELLGLEADEIKKIRNASQQGSILGIRD